MTSEKVLELDTLAEKVASLKKEGKKIVQCHGVFDLLHIGHIRHFRAAKKFGNVLVVTLTPDRYVNKGPNRPAFNERLRAEAIASLDVVDYVAINKWPTAEETLKLVKPNFYVKGTDYSDASKDVTRGITAEETAIKSVGGELKFTDDIVFSSSSLINTYLSVFSPAVKEYLATFSKAYPIEEVLNRLDKITDLKILVIGEAIIDEYYYGRTIGKAGKEPIIALKYMGADKFAGGSLAIANHLANFCGHVDLLAMLGENDTHEDFIEENLDKNVGRLFFYKKDSPTIVKKRFVENPPLKKLLEFYYFNDSEINGEQAKALKAKLEAILPKYDVVLVADFGHGMLNDELVQIIAKKSKFLAINTQTNAGNMGYNTVSKYPRTDVMCIDEQELRLDLRDKKHELEHLVSTASKKLSCSNIIVTRGILGCLCFYKGKFFKMPAFSEQIVDTMGAGDAFFSIASPLVALGAPIELAGFVGNVVGALAVAKVGNKKNIDKVSLYKSITSMLK